MLVISLTTLLLQEPRQSWAGRSRPTRRARAGHSPSRRRPSTSSRRTRSLSQVKKHTFLSQQPFHGPFLVPFPLLPFICFPFFLPFLLIPSLPHSLHYLLSLSFLSLSGPPALHYLPSLSFSYLPFPLPFTSFLAFHSCHFFDHSFPSPFSLSLFCPFIASLPYFLYPPLPFIALLLPPPSLYCLYLPTFLPPSLSLHSFLPPFPSLPSFPCPPPCRLV